MARFNFSIQELTYEEAQFSFSPDALQHIPSEPFHGDIIGQPRALQALKMALDIPSKGYNIFVTGDPGSGRTTAVRHLLSQAPPATESLQDIICVHNFEKTSCPKIIYLPAGRAVEFSYAMRKLTISIQQLLIDELQKLQSKRIDAQAVLEGISEDIGSLIREYPEPSIAEFLHGLTTDLKELIPLFTGADNDTVLHAQMFLRYSVNILADRKNTTHSPVVFEYHPTAANLFGYINQRSKEELVPPFLSVHAGSLAEASGGYIVMHASDILKEEHIWHQLKRVLTTGRILLHTTSAASGAGIKPDPIEINLKAIILGDEETYEELYTEDPDFSKLFKVAAEFDYSMPVNQKNIGKYIGFINMVVSEEHLLPISLEGTAEILRFGCFLAEQRGYLSTQFSRIADTLREANYWAQQSGSSVIGAEAVKQSLSERYYLSSLVESKIMDQILCGEILIHLKGKKVGMVNALAVIDRGNHSFGIPAVISATVAPGNEGIVNIEHEAGLSGEIHDKGLLILEGYLRKMYARNFPLSIYAGICFEQSYAEVEGDSASSSELFALLSAVGELPVRQDIAVTGSVNQMGEFQPVGGINEKISGFFTLCSRLGLTGHQGVIIPKSNIRNLILPEEVLKAMEQRKFHIYPVETIDEGMQILTERPAGKRNTKGVFPPDTINRIIEDRLKRLYDLSRQQN